MQRQQKTNPVEVLRVNVALPDAALDLFLQLFVLQLIKAVNCIKVQIVRIAATRFLKVDKLRTGYASPVLPSPRTVLFDDSPRAKPEFALLDLDLALLAHGVCTAGAFVGRDLNAIFTHVCTGIEPSLGGALRSDGKEEIWAVADSK